MSKLSEVVSQINKANSHWFDEDKYQKWFENAFETGLFSKDEPYMYMGEDFDKVYFKHSVTREYKNLNKR